MTSQPEPFLTHVTHRAMACDFVVMLPSQHAHRVEVALTALESLDLIENALTVYREDSEIMRVNRDAGREPVVVDQETFSLLQVAQHWSRLTEGAFDITAGPLIRVWGFLGKPGRKPSQLEINRARQKVGFQHLRLDAARRTVEFLLPEMEINLGAIGKGNAIDRLATQLRDDGIDDFLIHGGQSSVFAAGNADANDDRGWRVGLAHPTKPNRRLGGIWLKDAALSTSGSGNRFFHHRGKRFGHVIDPRTGYPAGDMAALTVIGVSATDVEAVSTGWFVAGSESAIRMNDAWGTDAWGNDAPGFGAPWKSNRPREESAGESQSSAFSMVFVFETDRQDRLRVQSEGIDVFHSESDL